MVNNKYQRDFAERCFSQIEGFGEYGFPESHAASFALLVYVSCWFKARYPDIFLVALLNSQPMGFYPAAQLVRDAREHGVDVRPVDINHSDWDNLLEDGGFDPDRIARRHASMRKVICAQKAVRLGFRQVKGLSAADMEQIVKQRGSGYVSVRDLWLRTGLPRPVIEKLAEADAFSSIGVRRREALWLAQALDVAAAAETLPLFAMQREEGLQQEQEMELPVMRPGEEVIEDYRTLALSLKAHPVSFLRDSFTRRGILASATLETTDNGRHVCVAGLVLVRQRPGSAKGVIFMTIEDETGVANIIVWKKIFEKYRAEVMGARLVQVFGKLQKADGVIHVVADRVEDMTGTLAELVRELPAFPHLSRADEVRRPVRDARPQDEERLRGDFMRNTPPEALGVHKVMPKGRNFH